MHKFWKSIGQVMFDAAVMEGDGGGGGAAVETDLGSVIADSIPNEIRDDSSPTPDTNSDPDEEKELSTLQQEIRQKNPNMRGRIDIDRHQAVLTRTRNQHAKALEEWTAKEKVWNERQEAIKAQEAELAQLEWAKDPDIQAGLQALALAERDQDQFIDLLLKDPRYAERIQRVQKDADKKAALEGRPKPNAKSPDGSFEYYDDAGTDELLNWYGQSLEGKLSEKLTKEIEARMEQKYGKVAQAFEQSTLWNEAKEGSAKALNTYRTEWDGFKEYEKDIKALLVANDTAREKDPRVKLLSIEEAYIKTVPKKFREAGQVSEDAMRKKIMEEMKRKPAAAGMLKPGTQPERSSEPGDRDLADIIRATIPREG